MSTPGRRQSSEHHPPAFVRLDVRVPGSGLGLAIARRTTRQRGGELTCDPVASGGSFTLRLPES
jgi:signal transduction histidine kinase